LRARSLAALQGFDSGIRIQRVFARRRRALQIRNFRESNVDFPILLLCSPGSILPMCRAWEMCYSPLRVVWDTIQPTKGATEMRIVKLLSTAVLGLSAFLLFALGTPAQAQRPHYLHALSNLRQARSLLQSDSRPGSYSERNHAINEIESAIQLVRAAARDSGRDTRFTPPPTTQGDPDRPLRSALTLLDEARQDVSRGLDAPEDRGLQARALRHIDEARSAVGRALHRTERGGDRDRYRGRRY
jgi:hypothetical protein